MSDTKIISFYGVKRADLLYYLGKLLATTDRPVLLVDNSERSDLFRIFARRDEEEAYYRNVTVIHMAAYREKTTAPFAYVLVYHGMDLDNEWWEHSELHYLLLNFDRFDTEDIGRGLAGLESLGTVRLIFSGRLTSKIKDSYIVRELGLPDKTIEDAMELSPETTADAMYLSLERDGIGKIGKLPKDFKDVLWSVVSDVLPSDNRRNRNKFLASAD